MRIKKGDTVKVLSGNDKGKTGEVLEVIPKTNKIIVKGVNIRKKHVKPRRQGEEGGIIPSEYPIHSCKVGVVCPKCGKVTRIEYKVQKECQYHRQRQAGDQSLFTRPEQTDTQRIRWYSLRKRDSHKGRSQGND